MRRATRSILAAVILAGGLAGVSAPVLADGAEDAIKARKSFMQVVRFNMAQLGAMVKGDVAYDAKQAQAAADNLMAVSGMDQTAMWPKGSDSAAHPGKTRALPKAWETYPEIREKNADFHKASMALAKDAGSGLEAMTAAYKGVGKTCGGCHKPFRAEKK